MGQGARKITVRRERPLRRVRILGRSVAIEGQEEPLFSVRIAVYRSGEEAPRIDEIASRGMRDVLDLASKRVYELARGEGGTIPFLAIREVVANLRHAECRGATVSILNQGCTVMVSDQGMGIVEKERALRPGFSTATPAMQKGIRGVGAGFAAAGEAMERVQGVLRIEENLGRGAVVTLDATDRGHMGVQTVSRPSSTELAHPELTNRQARVLLVVAEVGGTGPTTVAKELGLSLATAHRDLDQLEKLGFVQYVGKGKRALTPEGQEHIHGLFHE